jgi:hypothetical protein
MNLKIILLLLIAVNAEDYILPMPKLTEKAQEFDSKIPTTEIAPGVKIPMMGLGTWLYNDTTAYDSSLKALNMGYTLIDTAWDYHNGKGIAKAIKESGRARSSFFITTKVEGGHSFAVTLS